METRMAAHALMDGRRPSQAALARRQSVLLYGTHASHPANPPGSASRKNPRCFWPLFLAVVLVTVVAVVGSVVFLLISFLGNVKERSIAGCSNIFCTEYAKLLEASVNHSADRCHDFEAFVCGGWRRSEPESVRSVVALRALEDMTRAVRAGSDPPPTGQSVPQKVALLYRSCDDVVGAELDDMAAIREQLRLAGVEWPRRAATPDVPRTLTFLSVELDWPAVVTVNVAGRHELTVLMAPSFAQISMEQKRLHASANKKQHTFDLLKERFSDGRADNGSITLADLAHFEDAFFKVLDAASSDNRRYARVTDIPEWPNLLRTDEWQRALSEVNLSVATRYRRTVSWFTLAFFRLWRQFGDADTHLFVSWVAVRYTALFGSRDLIANYYDTGSLDKVRFEHGLFCYGLTYRFVGDAVFAPYVGSVFSPQVRQDVARIVTSIREKLVARLSRTEPFSLDLPVSTDWASLVSVFSVLQYSPSSYSTLSQLPDMGPSLARNWRAAARVRRVLGAAPRTLGERAFHRFYSYVLSGGDFKLTPYVLSYPIYEPRLVDAVKFGGLGGEVSRAAFEVAARHYRQNALVNAAIDEAAECIANATKRAGTQRPTNVAVRDLASVIVLNDAFAEAPGASQQLQDSGFSPQRLLFIAWCYLRCPGRSQRLADNCGAVLRHVAAFSDAFGCSLGAPLNPISKCRFF